MYIPDYYKNEDADSIRDFIDKNSFAILVSSVDGKPWATHIPLLFLKHPDGKEVLTGHISRGNKQWKQWDNQEVLAIFQGPHSYISSSWYDHESVPTWNYIAVHVYGNLEIIEGEALKNQLDLLVKKFEAGSEKPARLEEISKDYLENEMRGIVGFQIEITDIQAASKLSQNKDDKNYNAIINGLEKKRDQNSSLIAKEMKKKR